MNSFRNTTEPTKARALARTTGATRLAVAAGLLVGVFAAPVGAGQVHSPARLLTPGPPPGPGAMLPLLLRAVELTDAQSVEIKAISASHRARIGKLFLRLAAAQRDLADHLYGTEVVTDASVDARIDKVQKLREELMREGITAVLGAREILTAEQIERMAATNRHYRDLRAQMNGLFRPGAARGAPTDADASTD